MLKKIKIYFGLIKLAIVIPVTVSAWVGYGLVHGDVASFPFALVFGTLFLSAGSAALNQIQERNLDALMQRTGNRPLVSGAVSLRAAVMLVVVLLGTGLLGLYFFYGLTTCLLGVMAIIAYNAFYTPLKRLTAFAAVPGSIIGALPPAMGWAAGGGDLTDPVFLAIAMFFMMWQIPHFWLLLLSWGEDYRLAGLPTLLDKFSRPQLARITFVWILATVMVGLMLPLFVTLPFYVIHLLILAAGSWVVVTSVQLLHFDKSAAVSRMIFRNINIYTLLVVMLILVGRING